MVGDGLGLTAACVDGLGGAGVLTPHPAIASIPAAIKTVLSFMVTLSSYDPQGEAWEYPPERVGNHGR